MLPDEINELAGFINSAIKKTMKENRIKLKKTVTDAIELMLKYCKLTPVQSPSRPKNSKITIYG